VLRFVLRKVLTSVVLAVFGIGAGHFIAGTAGSTDRDLGYPAPPTIASDSAPRHTSLLDQHHCWTHQAPSDMQGKVPGHVVVTTRKGRTRYGGAHLVGLALDQQFAHKHAGLTVWGFCR
jgi:hypothetical protein